VFDGSLGRSYLEPDAAAPSTAYGESKAEGEKRVLTSNGDALIVRSSSFFGPWDRYNFLYETLRRLARGEEVEASATRIVSPTYVPELVQATLDLLLDEASGLWHLANQGAASFHDLAHEAADRAGLDKRLIRLADTAPSDTSLSSERGILLRPVDEALTSFMEDVETLTFA